MVLAVTSRSEWPSALYLTLPLPPRLPRRRSQRTRGRGHGICQGIAARSLARCRQANRYHGLSSDGQVVAAAWARVLKGPKVESPSGVLSRENQPSHNKRIDDAECGNDREPERAGLLNTPACQTQPGYRQRAVPQRDAQPEPWSRVAWAPCWLPGHHLAA